MRYASFALLLIACGQPPAPSASASAFPSASATSTSTSTATPTSTSTPTPTSTATATPTPTSTLAPAPTYPRCSAGQLNTPCLFKKEGECFLRRNNCAGLPCTEAAPEAIPCPRYESAIAADACSVHTKCFGQYKEGCIVGARADKLTLAIPPACAEALLRASSCDQVRSAFEKPICRSR